ncbi:MAG: aldehyde dehydrogenase family protein, partial [Catalinimonas sp.]
TTGQAWMMSFQASGPHAADRALEAVAAAWEELGRFPAEATWEKPMGKYDLRLKKQWRAVPKGIGLVVGCSTFPTWNSVPGLYASLMTGNPVLVKPHPKALLPIAIVVSEFRKALRAAGFDPNVCQLAADVPARPVTKRLAEDPAVRLIDYTGGTAFGDYLEALPGKQVFTEKAGVNSVILDSVEDLEAVLQNLAFSVSLYSGQMCTAPQNFFIPAGGVRTPDGPVSFEEVGRGLAKAMSGLASHPKAGPHVLGAVQNPATAARVQEVQALGHEVMLASGKLDHPQFPEARTTTGTLLVVDAADRELYDRELFGPIALLIRTADTDESIRLARELAERRGAISCGAYTTDDVIKEKIKDQMGLAATPVSFNLTGNIYLNQNASFSDFHVTGGNPAGNASFTDPAYVVRRFTWVGFREPA